MTASKFARQAKALLTLLRSVAPPLLVIAALVRCLSANATLFAAGSGASKVRAD